MCTISHEFEIPPLRGYGKESLGFGNPCEMCTHLRTFHNRYYYVFPSHLHLNDRVQTLIYRTDLNIASSYHSLFLFFCGGGVPTFLNSWASQDIFKKPQELNCPKFVVFNNSLSHSCLCKSSVVLQIQLHW